MKTNWQTKKLGDVCDLQNGFAFKSKDYVSRSETLNFRMSNIRPGGFVDIYHNQKFLPDNYATKYKDFLLKDGDLVIAMTDMATETKILGVPTIVQTEGKKLLLNQRVGKFFDIQNDRVYVPFLRYMLSSEQINDHYKSLGRGGMQINIGKQDILNVEIPLPSLSEQHRIVKILDKAFEKIEKAKENAEKNLRNSKEIFEYYLRDIFTNKKKDWEVKKLGEVAEYFNGLTYAPKNVSGKGVIVLRSSNVQKDELDFSDIVRVSCPIREKVMVREGDILMCSRNGSKRLVGKTATIKNLKEAMTFGTFMMIIRGEHNPYLAWFFKSTEFRKQISGGENTMINQITRYMLDDVMVVFPPQKEQKVIVKKLDALSEQTKKLELIYKQKLVNLEELKKSVLNKAFTGEL
ncbi:MAG: restriction endonuclease subunit S [Candidatus Woesebacteria bacterium]|nr:restriction endonuclease subunit S [Candidatus Woesebacteria bacterium]